MGKYYLGTGTNQYNFQVVDSTGVIQDLNLSGLYLSITGKAADADKLDNLDSSYFLNAKNLTGIYTGVISGTVENANTLDGLDSSYFLNGANITGTVQLSGTFTGYYTGVFSGTISHTDYIQFHTGLGINPDPAELTWNDGLGTMELGLKGGNVDLRVGLQNYEYVTNRTASTISKGSVIYVSGAQGNRPSISLALGAADTTSANTFGLAAEDIASMADGYVITNGLLTNLNTTGFAEGAALYLSPTVSGAVTSTKPQAPQHSVLVGFCVRSHASAGEILVKIQNGLEIDELHDVRILNKQNNDILRYNAPSGIWYNSDTLAINGTGANYISGDLGIGTSAPTAKLHIVGANKRQIITSTTDNAALVLGQWDSVTNRIESSTRKLLITSYTSGIALGNSGSEDFYLNTSGNVGIGTTVIDSRLTLKSAGDYATFYNNSDVKRLTITNAGELSFNTSSTLGLIWGTASLRFAGQFEGVQIIPYSTTYVGLSIKGNASQTESLQYWKDSAGTVLSRVNADGAIQIGAKIGSSVNVYSFSGYKFGIESGSARIIGPELTAQNQTSNALDILLGSNAAWGNLTSRITFTARDRGNNVDAGTIAFIGVNKTSDMNVVGSGELIFGTAAASSSTSTERMRIDKNGNIGIGATTPNQKLEIKGGNVRIDNRAAGSYSAPDLEFLSGDSSGLWNVFKIRYTKNATLDRLEFIDGGNSNAFVIANGGSIGFAGTLYAGTTLSADSFPRAYASSGSWVFHNQNNTFNPHIFNLYGAGGLAIGYVSGANADKYIRLYSAKANNNSGVVVSGGSDGSGAGLDVTGYDFGGTAAGGYARLYAHNNGSGTGNNIYLATGGSDRLTIDKNGTVLVNSTTAYSGEGLIQANGRISAIGTGASFGNGLTGSCDPAFFVGSAAGSTVHLFGFGSGARAGLIRGYQDGGGTVVFEFGRVQSNTWSRWLKIDNNSLVVDGTGASSIGGSFTVNGSSFDLTNSNNGQTGLQVSNTNAGTGAFTKIGTWNGTVGVNMVTWGSAYTGRTNESWIYTNGAYPLKLGTDSTIWLTIAPTTGLTTLGGALNVSGAGRNVFSGCIGVSGSNPTHATSMTIIDHASPIARIIGYGPNASTAGSFSFIGLSSDGTVGGTRFSIDGSGNASFNGTISSPGGTNSERFGVSTTLGTGINNTAIGASATTASGNTGGNVAIGRAASAIGGDDIAIGSGAVASGGRGVSLGLGASTTATNYGVAIGWSSASTGGVRIGGGGTAVNSSIAIGSYGATTTAAGQIMLFTGNVDSELYFGAANPAGGAAAAYYSRINAVQQTTGNGGILYLAGGKGATAADTGGSVIIQTARSGSGTTLATTATFAANGDSIFAGNVGIGESVPASKLHIKGTTATAITITDDTNYHFAIENNNGVISYNTDTGNAAATSASHVFKRYNIDLLKIDQNGKIILTPQNYSQNSWTTTGALSSFGSATVTNNNTAQSTTAASAVFYSFAIPTLAAANTSVTTTDAAVVYIAGNVAAGTNQTITNSWGLWNAGKTRLDGNINIDGAINFLRGSGEYSTYIKSSDYIDAGYNSSTLRYWIELGSKGGTHIILNTDGSETAAENSYDHFTIWQYTNGSGAIAAGARKFWITNTGRVNFVNSVWHKSSEGVERFHYGTSGSTFYKGGGTGNIHTFRNASDEDIFTLTNAKNASLAGDLTIAGNLTINGTTVTVNSTVTTIDDPIITLGGDTSVAETTKDRGIEFKWNGTTLTITNYIGNGTTTVTGTVASTSGYAAGDIITISGATGTEQSKLNGTWKIASVPNATTFTFVVSSSVASATYTANLGTTVKSKNGFFGLDQSTGRFTFIPQADNSSEVFSGTLGSIEVGGIVSSGSISSGQLFVSHNSATQEAITITNTAAGGKVWVLGPKTGNAGFGIRNSTDTFQALSIAETSAGTTTIASDTAITGTISSSKDFGATSGEKVIGLFVRGTGATDAGIYLGYRADGTNPVYGSVRSVNSRSLALGTTANPTAIVVDNSGNSTLVGNLTVGGSQTLGGVSLPSWNGTMRVLQFGDDAIYGGSSAGGTLRLLSNLYYSTSGWKRRSVGYGTYLSLENASLEYKVAAYDGTADTVASLTTVFSIAQTTNVAEFTGRLTTTNATDSTSTSTGSFVASGGAGIAKTLSTAGRILTTSVKTSAYTIATTDHVIICDSATAFTITMIAASSNSGRQFIIKNKNIGEITISATSLGQIDGFNTIALSQYQSVTLVSDGTTWNRI